MSFCNSNGRARYRARFLLLFAAAPIALFCLWAATRPTIAILGESGVLASCPAGPGTGFSARFIHSVQKTPVEEYFAVNETIDGFILKKTRYQSFGVGLPFLPSDGSFRREGNAFVMDGMNRPMREIDLRPGVSTELTLFLPEETVPLYERVPLGSLVRVALVPRWRLWLRQYNFPEKS